MASKNDVKDDDLTRGELRRREEAVVAGFVERNGDKDK